LVGGRSLGIRRSRFLSPQRLLSQARSPELWRAIIQLHELHNASATLIEDTELGRALAQDLYRTGHLRAIAQRPERDKLARLLAQAARFEADQIHLPESAPWLATYLNELLGFPNSTHDDQVDATSQALNWLTGRTPLDRPLLRKDLRRRDIARRDPAT
jgi:predicted phage terminase large subunit-like protein